MSAKEKLLNEIDYMPENFIDAVLTMWTIAKPESIEMPNAETTAALLDPNKEYTSYDTVDDMLKDILGEDYAEKY
jgi:hypothetical protein